MNNEKEKIVENAETNAYIKQLKAIKQENASLRKELSRKIQEQVENEEEKERLRVLNEGNVNVHFDGDLLAQNIPYRIIAVLKYLPEYEGSEDAEETLKRFEQHMLAFSYSRGSIQILISNIKRLAEKEKEKGAENGQKE